MDVYSPRFTHLYVSLLFVSLLINKLEILNEPFLMATLVGEPLFVEHVYKSYEIMVIGQKTLANLMVLGMMNLI